MRETLHPRLQLVGEIAYGLARLAEILIKTGLEFVPQPPRPKQGATLRPGRHTPLWNALVTTIRPHLRPYGARTALARMLEVPPQRVYEYFRVHSAAPDAERVLRLVVWLSRGAPRLVPPRRGRKKSAVRKGIAPTSSPQRKVASIPSAGRNGGTFRNIT